MFTVLIAIAPTPVCCVACTTILAINVVVLACGLWLRRLEQPFPLPLFHPLPPRGKTPPLPTGLTFDPNIIH